MSCRDKIISWDALPAWRDSLKARGLRLVATNGCFDLLHAGHVTYLEQARSLGDALLIGLNSDASVRALKGPKRPINNQNDRALVIAALESVEGVCVFEDVRAATFLERARPDIYVKGGDYTLETLNAEERRAVENSGGRIVLVPLVKGVSTTCTLAVISQLSKP